MGLSASQTRFLTLTARKSNVEYQGQQINQARTALANQSSQLYTQLMSLDAPTAPSPYQYVINPLAKPDIDWSQPNAYPIQNKELEKDFAIYYAGYQPQFKDFNIPEYEKTTTNDENGNPVTSWAKISYDKEGKKVTTPIEGTPSGTYCYQETGKDGAGVPVNYTAIVVDDEANFTYDIENNEFVGKTKDAQLPSYIEAYNAASRAFNIYSEPTSSAIFTETSNPQEAKPVAYNQNRKLNINQAQYQAAMAQYEADLAEYEKVCNEINAKTEEIHEADKKLELQLKQLDTEQEAIQTEYEAVKKVIDKNIENTFKSFA